MTDDDDAETWETPCKKCGSYRVKDDASNMTTEQSLDLSWHCADCGEPR